MQVVLGLIEFFGARPNEKGFVVCLGFFDGVHLGHRSLLAAAVDIGQKARLQVCVHTYSAAPGTLIHPERAYHELTSLPEKVDLLLRFGADTVAVSRFDQRMMLMDGAQFIDDELGSCLSVRHLVVGADHRFGFQARTGPSQLTQLCSERGIGLTVVEPLTAEDGSVISSTAIKCALMQGDVKKAEAMLGRPVTEVLIKRFQEMKQQGGKDA